jgi:putative Holliday junction resolvase
MRSLGLDIGDRRTGVAISDPQGILAFPLTVITEKTEDTAINEITKLVQQHDVGCIVVGLPLCLNGGVGQQANKVTAFAERLSQNITIDVQLWDERLSSVAAERSMIEACTKKNKRKQQRDAIAAAFILQGFLDSLRETSL